jgi:hypothetical protein
LLRKVRSERIRGLPMTCHCEWRIPPRRNGELSMTAERVPCLATRPTAAEWETRTGCFSQQVPRLRFTFHVLTFYILTFFVFAFYVLRPSSSHPGQRFGFPSSSTCSVQIA